MTVFDAPKIEITDEMLDAGARAVWAADPEGTSNLSLVGARLIAASFIRAALASASNRLASDKGYRPSGSSAGDPQG